MDGLSVLGILAVLILMGAIALCKAAAKADEDNAATAERLAMRNRDWLFPQREDS